MLRLSTTNSSLNLASLRWLIVLVLAFSASMATDASAQALSGTGVPRASLYHSQVLLYARDHEISLNKAAQRLEWQRLAPGLQSEARLRLGPNFGGVWIDSKGDGRVKLGVANSNGSTLNSAHDIVADSGLVDAVDIVHVAHSERELNAVVAWLDARFARVSASTPIAFGIAPDLSTVQVSVAPNSTLSGAQQAVLEEAQKLYGSAVSVGFDDIPVNPASCSYPFCTVPLRSGVRVEPENFEKEVGGKKEEFFCTGGFLGRGREDGALYQFTAGHCYFLVEASWGTRITSKEPWLEIGIWKKHYVGESGDAAIFQVADDSYWHSRPWVYWAGYSESYPIFSDADPVKGQEVCKSGASYGTTSCGEVTFPLVKAEIKYGFPFETKLVEVAIAKFCSKSGDSGSPVHYYGVAYGLMTSFGEGCNSSFTLIHKAEDLMKVDVRHESECDPLFESPIKIADITGDGKDDVLQFPGGGKVNAWESKGTSYSSLGEVGSGFGSVYQDRVGDKDADGDDDAFQMTDNGDLYPWEAKGSVYTSLGKVGEGFGSACDTRVADINSDGKIDVLRFTNDGYGYGWLAGKGGYDALGQVGTGFGSTYQDRTGDMDGDGDDDLFQINDNGKVYKWTSNGSSYSGGAELFSGVGNASQVRFADLEGDGDDDIFRFSDAGVGSLWKSKGTSYESVGSIGTEFGLTRQMRVADIDGDGDTDILKFADDGKLYAWIFNGSTYTSKGNIASGFGKP